MCSWASTHWKLSINYDSLMYFSFFNVAAIYLERL